MTNVSAQENKAVLDWECNAILFVAASHVHKAKETFICKPKQLKTAVDKWGRVASNQQHEEVICNMCDMPTPCVNLSENTHLFFRSSGKNSNTYTVTLAI